MKAICEKIIFNENLAWGKSLENELDKFVTNLSSATIQEIIENRNKLKNLNDHDFPLLKNEILNYKKKMLLDGYGFFLINGTCFKLFSTDEQRSIFAIIADVLGELLIQNIKNEKFVEIKNVGKSMKTGGRYHETKSGGSYHTDSPQWEEVPDHICLFCINPAKQGGTSKLLSAYSIHNNLLKKNREILEVLYEKFHFDKRGEFKEGESKTVFAPIFEYKNGEMNCRYLRDYIEDGHKVQNQPLTDLEKKALDEFDKILYDENLAISYDLKSGDMMFSDNHRILHGRTRFEDYAEDDYQRFMIRTWVKDRKNIK